MPLSNIFSPIIPFDIFFKSSFLARAFRPHIVVPSISDLLPVMRKNQKFQLFSFLACLFFVH